MAEDIPFMQYRRPNGMKVPCSIRRPDEIAEKAAALIRAGYSFSCEVLQTDEVALYCEQANSDDVLPLAVEVVPNNPRVPEAVDTLVTRAWEQLQLEGKAVYRRNS